MGLLGELYTVCVAETMDLERGVRRDDLVSKWLLSDRKSYI